MSETENRNTADFDWSPLGEKFWTDAGQTAKATPVQVKFARCLHSGMTMKASAAAAGYKATSDDAMKKLGSRAAQTVAVKTMLAMAVSEDGGTKVSEYVDQDEARKILSALARRGDATTKLRAVEQLNKMAAAEPSETEQYLNRPERFIAEWVRLLPYPYNIIVGVVMGLWPGKIGLGTNICYLQPLTEVLIPHLAQDFPEVWQRLVADYPNNDWERQCLEEVAKRPRRPIGEILDQVEKRCADFRRDHKMSPPPKVKILSDEQFKAATATTGNGHV